MDSRSADVVFACLLAFNGPCRLSQRLRLRPPETQVIDSLIVRGHVEP